MHSPTDIHDDLSLLFELSLSVGATLDPEENAAAFAETLCARKDLEGVAVWMKASDGDGLRLLRAAPASYVDRDRLPPDHELVRRLRDADAPVSVHASETQLTDVQPGRSVRAGAFAALPLGTLGVVEMYDSRRDAPFTARELRQLRPVLVKLEQALRGARSHQQLADEVDRRVRTEKALRRSEERWRCLVESNRDPIQITVDGIIRYINPAGARIFGADTTGALIGRSPVDFASDPDTAERLRARKEQLDRGEPTEPFEHTIRRLDGEQRIIVSYSQPVEYEGKQAAQTVIRDVTEQRKAQEELRHLKNFYEQVLTTMPIDLAIFGPEGRYKYVTPSAVSDAERRRQVIGMTDVEYARLRGHDVDTARTRLETIRRVARTREMEQFEETLEEASGRSRHFIRFVMPVVQDGAVRSVLGYGMEITKRKQAEMELRDAKEQAEASLAAKERFLATMSHEVRTPLNAVLGMAQLLARTELSEQQRSYLQSIHFSGDTLLTLLNTVLDFAKLEAGEVDLDEAAFDPARLAHHVRDMLRSKAEENQLDFRVETDPELPASVVGDAARVGQILTNLGSNALKFTPDGSVVLHVETAPSVEHADAPEPTTEGADAPTWITFRVEDTGRGIAPDQQDRIFGHFNQADVGAEEAREGTGLGLAIVQTLVDQMGGTIDVQSTPGEGSTFSVHLPFAAQGAGPEREATGDEDGGFGEAGSGSPTAPSPAAAPPARAAEGDALSGLDVLVVEDNATNQVVVRDLLLGWGTRVDVAADGQAALERLRSAHYDLVLMDIQMPRMDGLEATRRLRRDLECDLPVVALTASMRRENRDEVFAAGMDAFVSKPFKPATLYQTLTRQVSGSSPSSSSGSSSSSTPAGPTPAGSAPAAPEDLALVDLGFLRENMSDPQAVRDVATALLDQIGTFLDDLSAARRDQDEDRLGALFHRLKSAAQMAGAERLGQHAQALDRTDPPYDTDRLDDVARVARRTRTALDDRLHVLADTVSR